MKYELDLNSEQYQLLTDALEKARQAEVNSIQDITDSKSFGNASSLSKIQDSLATQHNQPEKPSGMVGVLQGAFERAFDTNETQAPQESLENSLNAEMGAGELVDRFLQEIDASPGGIDGLLETANNVNSLEHASQREGPGRDFLEAFTPSIEQLKQDSPGMHSVDGQIARNLEHAENVGFFREAQSAAFNHGSIDPGEVIHLDLPDGHRISMLEDSVVISKEVKGESSILYEQELKTAHLSGHGETFRDSLPPEIKASILDQVAELDHKEQAANFGIDLEDKDLQNSPAEIQSKEGNDGFFQQATRGLKNVAKLVMPGSAEVEQVLADEYQLSAPEAIKYKWELQRIEENTPTVDHSLVPKPGSREDVLDAARYIANEMGDSDYSGGRSIETDSFKIETYGNEVKVFDHDGNKVIEANQSSGQQLYRPTPDLVDVLTESANEIERKIGHDTPGLETDEGIEIDDD